jgi:hypothetical protein
MIRTALVAAAALAALLAGCGEKTDKPAAKRVAWVDPGGLAPYIGSLSVNPADGSLLLASNTGLFRIPPGGGTPVKETGVLKAGGVSGKVSESLVVRFTGPNQLIGSGHPSAGESDLPLNLGLMASDDDARTWRSVSKLGEADFHSLARSGNQLVAPVFGQTRIDVSTDGGKTFASRVGPAPLTDLAVDPSDPEHWVASSAQGTFVSKDDGHTWRPWDSTADVRLAWVASDKLYGLSPDGTVRVSADGGQSWKQRGKAGEVAGALTAGADGTLYEASVDGAVRRSSDGGASWKEIVTP